MKKFQITNFKSQIISKFSRYVVNKGNGIPSPAKVLSTGQFSNGQRSVLEHCNFDGWNLFGIWCLEFVISVLLLFLLTANFAYAQNEQGGGSMKLISPEFENNKYMPAKYTCEGEEVNPALVIEGMPASAKSLALIVDDPDAPRGTWVHWVVYDMPIIGKIEENSVPGVQGKNDSNPANFGGPCPPSGTHRYFFKIYALDTKLNLPQGQNKQELEKAMQGHILDKAELVGLYKKK